MIITQELTLDILRENSFKVVRAKQFDEDTRYLKITVTAQGEEQEVESSSVIILCVKRADSQEKNYTGEVEDGKILIKLPNWLLQCEGRSTCSVSMVKDGRLSTLSFAVDVEPSQRIAGNISEDDEGNLSNDFFDKANEVLEVAANLKAALEKMDTLAETVSTQSETLEKCLRKDTSLTQKRVYGADENGDTVVYPLGAANGVPTTDSDNRVNTNSAFSKVDDSTLACAMNVGDLKIAPQKMVQMGSSGALSAAEKEAWLSWLGLTSETWALTLEDGSTVTKKIVVLAG